MIPVVVWRMCILVFPLSNINFDYRKIEYGTTIIYGGRSSWPRHPFTASMRHGYWQNVPAIMLFSFLWIVASSEVNEPHRQSSMDDVYCNICILHQHKVNGEWEVGWGSDIMQVEIEWRYLLLCNTCMIDLSSLRGSSASLSFFSCVD